jgi:hypothetical protein
VADQKKLMERLAAGAFDPPVAYADLADAHLDFAGLVAHSPEAELRDRAERRSGCCVVLGGSGSGKSSLIASVAASLEPTRFPVRVQGVSGEVALTREGFAVHVGHETLRALRSMAVGRPPERRLRPAGEGLAASQTRRRGGHSVGFGVPLPVEFSAQLASSAREVVQERDASAVAQALEALVAVSERFERRLLLVVEDTDVFMPPDPVGADERERPRRFVDHVISYLAREFPSSSLVAVNSRYRELLPSGTIGVVEVPALAPDSLGRLLEHYARRAGFAAAAEAIAEPDALAYAAGRYAETGDIRRLLELFHKATRKMVGEGRGGRVNVEILHGL